MILRYGGLRLRMVLVLAAGWIVAVAIDLRGGEDGVPAGFSEEERSYWFFQPVKRPEVPVVKKGEWCRNEIDHFILAELEREGLAPAGEANRRTLIRRLYVDLIGLPPDAGEVKAFEEDLSADAYEKVVERLLESPRYGERWAQHWLDLVRYAESDGYRADAYRPEAWRYRDYVIRSLNEDKPYDEFVMEQLAGDEIAPDDPEVLVATGYLRHWIYEHNQRDVRGQWSDILADVTDVTGEVFMGMGMGCARCHDHKFDPIRQSDYYRLQAFFAPMLPRTDLSLGTAKQRAEYEARLREWKSAAAEVLAEIEEIERPHREAVIEQIRIKFPDDIKEMWDRAPEERGPLESQLAELAYRQLYTEGGTFEGKIAGRIKGEEKERWEALREKLKEFDELKPRPLPEAFIVTDVGPEAPATFIPGREKGARFEPGVPVVLGMDWCFAEPIRGNGRSTGRRSALARWLTRGDNPLTARVMVNRIWQHHFGRGIVGTANDFGRLGERPTHPELLDWLASEFVRRGWSVKEMHRLMVSSATYRQSAVGGGREGKMKDPENRLYWRMGPRRMEAEQIRDALLLVSGELDLKMGGPGVKSTTARRSVYLQVFRNKRDALLEVFDVPDGYRSMARRNVTTTPPQALLMMNGDWVLGRAQTLAERLLEDEPEWPEEVVEAAYLRVFGREPRSEERAVGMRFLGEQRDRVLQESSAAGGEEAGDGAEKAGLIALADYCHVLLNSNEFIYVE